MGIRGLVLDLIKSYLSNRRVSTHIKDKASDPLLLEDGVPQGSVLGPTLYLLYINSLRYLLTKGEQTIYADDTCFLYHSKNQHELENYVIDDLRKYLGWLSGCKLVINMTKTNYILFRSNRKPDINLNISYGNHNIDRLSNTKYLGVYLDEQLNWSHHFESIRKKIDPLIGAARRCPQFPNDIAKLVFNSHFLSKIRPNLLIWGTCNEGIMDKVQVLINRSLKALFRLDWFTSLEELISTTDTFTIRELLQIDDVNLYTNWLKWLKLSWN